VVLGFTPNNAIGLLASPPAELFNTLAARIEVSDALAMAAVNAKQYYDGKHVPMFMNVGDVAYIRLHKGHSIPLASKKLGQQRIGPFCILERIGRLAYKLDIPQHWRIHPVFTIAQLEPGHEGTADPYARPRPDEPGTVFVEGDDEFNKSYELEKVLDKRITPTGLIRYLVRWKG
jgi:hypothetical protein